MSFLPATRAMAEEKQRSRQGKIRQWYKTAISFFIPLPGIPLPKMLLKIMMLSTSFILSSCPIFPPKPCALGSLRLCVFALNLPRIAPAKLANLK